MYPTVQVSPNDISYISIFRYFSDPTFFEFSKNMTLIITKSTMSMNLKILNSYN